MSTEQQTAEEGTATPGEHPAEPPEPKLRRRPFGFSKRDVRAALERQTAELGAREAELAELRQDIAALWLAFAQHDRMIRRALGEGPAAEAPARPGAVAPQATAAAPRPEASPEDAPAATAAAEDDAAIGRQLSDLDDVLAAIELATKTLERTYVGETAQRAEGPAAEGPVDGKGTPG